MSLLELFCAVDDFCKGMDEEQAGRLLASGKPERRRAGQLSDSEALTIMIHFHQSQYRNFKAYYQQHVQMYLQAEFPRLISYGRFVQRMPRLLGWVVPLPVQSLWIVYWDQFCGCDLHCRLRQSAH